MNVDECHMLDQDGTVFETIIENNIIHSALINHMEVAETLTPAADPNHTFYAFNFFGFSRVGAEQCEFCGFKVSENSWDLVKLQCMVSIVPVGIEETTPGAVIIAHMTEPSRYD